MALTDIERKAKVNGRRGLQARVARRLGVEPSSVSEVVSGRSTSRRIRAAIARELRMPIKDVFPPRVKGVVADSAVL
jgi:DNA-binding transcriptional regulator YdaS (Cro superfamily)